MRDQFHSIHLFDLEKIEDINMLTHPHLTLQGLDGLIIIDEVQLKPDLFPTLRVLIDTPSQNQHWLILGSASQNLLRQSSETLAGRIAYLEINPFDLTEI